MFPLILKIYRAYEAGTTQNARSLGRSTVRRRRASFDGASTPSAPITTIDEQRPIPPAQPKKVQSQHAIFFGTEDVATLKKSDEPSKKDVEIPDDERAKEDTKQTKEWQELCSLARDVFHVYFTLDDSKTDISKMKQMKKKNILTWVNGTMPQLPRYLAKLELPSWIVNVLLFVEASFRGIAQVRDVSIIPSERI